MALEAALYRSQSKFLDRKGYISASGTLVDDLNHNNMSLQRQEDLTDDPR